MRSLVSLACLAACGRSGFDPNGDARDAPVGDATDAIDATMIDGPPDAFAGPSGMALRTDGTNSYVRIDEQCAEMTAGFTISAWVHPDVAQVEGYSAVFALNTNNGDNYSMFMWDTNVMGRFDYYDDVYTNGIEAGFAGADGNWNFLSAVIDATGVGALYQNGELSNSFITPRVVSAPCRVSIAQEWDGNGATNFFTGYYDEITIWNVAKTQVEIQADMRANITGTEPGLVGYYTFEAGNAHDASTHQHDGTLVGATVVASP